jgi:hypothetical protein
MLYDADRAGERVRLSSGDLASLPPSLFVGMVVADYAFGGIEVR